MEVLITVFVMHCIHTIYPMTVSGQAQPKIFFVNVDNRVEKIDSSQI